MEWGRADTEWGRAIEEWRRAEEEWRRAEEGWRAAVSPCSTTVSPCSAVVFPFHACSNAVFQCILAVVQLPVLCTLRTASVRVCTTGIEYTGTQCVRTRERQPHRYALCTNLSWPVRYIPFYTSYFSRYTYATPGSTVLYIPVRRSSRERPTWYLRTVCTGGTVPRITDTGSKAREYGVPGLSLIHI